MAMNYDEKEKQIYSKGYYILSGYINYKMSDKMIFTLNINNIQITVYFRVGSIGPFPLPYISDAGGATNQINYAFTNGKIFVYRHTYNTCRFNNGIAEVYPGQPVMVNLPQSLEYRYVIQYND
jgi:hypothetical protein